ncbi:hypothetical protein A8713_16285 [Streptomyces sp. SAT1]|uniref:hypothetical protein n=1 Tax=Streptomyces sp. SAT1 TaxID=1849967 RepID=UPI0007DD5A05|nr:hypothetical protein [Streptomyces sp. SAT1]ANH92526.1 hypothetical protein A8713_16285 [Streptomyces sp. SAT1]
MPRLPAVRVLAVAALCAAGPPVLTACGSGQEARPAAASPSAAAASRPAAPRTPAAPTAPAAPAGLTAAQAQVALLTEDDLGVPWEPTEGAATWRDGILKARTGAGTAPDCQRLIDALYADQPLGAPTGTYAVTGFDDGDDRAQLRHQVLTLRPADVDRTLAWLRTLPRTCARFTAATTRAGEQTVRVSDLALPALGDARQGLRITFTGPRDSADGANGADEPDFGGREDDGDGTDTTALTLDVVAVRVGGDALTLTDGAPGDLPSDATLTAAQLGVERLTAARDGTRAQA